MEHQANEKALVRSPYGWGRAGLVRDWLFEAGYCFEFYQAVRLLEHLRPEAAPPGHGVEPDKEPVRFHSAVRFDFPASEVQEIERPKKAGAPAEMTVNFLSLAGSNGPLPDPFGEMLIESAWRGNPAFRDFLDIFHHRLVSLIYRVRKAHFPALTAEAPHLGQAARSLYALMGLGLANLRDRLEVPDRSLLYYSGLFSASVRSAAGLRQLLGDYFQVAVGVHQFLGRWRPLEPAHWTRLGISGQNQVLGSGACMGTRVWNDGSAVLVRLGPLRREQFLNLLPGRSGHRALRELTRFYLGPETDAIFELELAPHETIAGWVGHARLGHTSWLRTEPARHHAVVRLGGDC